MESPRATYIKNYKNAGRLRKEFTSTFNDIYISGTQTKTGLGDSNEEEAIRHLGKFIPGKIFTYQYDPLYKDRLDWYDTRPIILVMETKKAGNGNWLVKGININFLPEIATVQTLEQFYDIFKDDINKSQNLSFLGKVNLNISKIYSFFTDWLSVISVFNDGAGVGFQFAYRTYIVSRIKDPRYVEYQHWEMLPFLNPQEIVGASIAEIYKTYDADKVSLLKGDKKKNK